MKLSLATPMFLALAALDCSSKPASPTGYVDAGVAIAAPICTLLEGITENKTIISICADVEEIALIASTILQVFGTGAPDGGETCLTLPGTAVCATKAQIGRGIQTVLMRRRARLLLDAGLRDSTIR